MNTPLVSVPVITFNSSEYIIEGLESIKAQTYENIELIISDDCSTDNTVELCREWLDKNKGRFIRVELVTTDKNTGVAGNCNRAIRACQGEWIKLLSGDDKFLPYTIEKYIQYAEMNPDASIIFGKLKFFGSDEKETEKNKRYYEKFFYPKIRLELPKQYIEDLKGLFVPGPGLFYRKSLWEEIGGFEERYQFCEEDPFMHKVFKAGYRVFFLDEEVYGYQIRSGSLSKNDNVEKKQLIIPRHYVERMQYSYDVKLKEMIKSRLYLNAWDIYLKHGLISARCKHSKFMTLIYTLLRLTSPVFYKGRLENIIYEFVYNK